MRAALAAFVLLVLLFQISVGSAAAVLPVPGEAESTFPAYVPGEIVVGFTKGSDSEQISSSLDAVDAEDSESVPGLSKTRVVEIDEDDDVEVATDELEDQGGVRWAEPNYIVEGQGLPNDPRLGLLWGLRNDGQNSQHHGSGRRTGIWQARSRHRRSFSLEKDHREHQENCRSRLRH